MLVDVLPVVDRVRAERIRGIADDVAVQIVGEVCGRIERAVQAGHLELGRPCAAHDRQCGVRHVQTQMSEVEDVRGAGRPAQFVTGQAIDRDRDVQPGGAHIPFIAVHGIGDAVGRERRRAGGRLHAHAFQNRQTVFTAQVGDRGVAAEGARQRSLDDHLLDRIVRRGGKRDEEDDDAGSDDGDALPRRPRERALR
jgi:hypothetical protein